MALPVPAHARHLVSKKIKLPKFKNVSDAICWLEAHPIYLGPDGMSHFDECFSWMCPLVDPKTNRIEDKKKRNTAVRFWVESGPWYFVRMSEEHPDVEDFWASSHNIQLDTGAKTFEKAMMKLVKLVHKVYGGYKKKKVLKFIIARGDEALEQSKKL